MVARLTEPFRKRSADGIFHSLKDGADGGGFDGGGGPSGLPPMTYISGDTFRASHGVRVFPSYVNGTGGKLIPSQNGGSTSGQNYLTDLNPGFITHKVTPAADIGTTVTNWAKAMYDNFNIQTVFTVGEPFETYTDPEWASMMAKISNIGDAVFMVNGQNEVNHVRSGGAPPSNWATIAANHQARLWSEMVTINAARTSAGKRAIKVGTPTLWSGSIPTHDADAATLLPMVVGKCNYINWHLYPRGVDPNFHIDDFTATYRGILGNLPIICSEGGYFVAANYSGGSIPVTAATQDIYLRKHMLEYAMRGFMLGQFELLNDVDTGSTAAGDSNTIANDNREANLGIVTTTTTAVSGWGKRPAYNGLMAYHNLTGGSSGSTGVEIQTSASGVQRLLVRHALGYKLFLWRRVDIEKNKLPVALSPATISVDVTYRATGASVDTTVTRAVAGDVVEVDWV